MQNGQTTPGIPGPPISLFQLQVERRLFCALRVQSPRQRARRCTRSRCSCSRPPRSRSWRGWRASSPRRCSERRESNAHQRDRNQVEDLADTHASIEQLRSAKQRGQFECSGQSPKAECPEAHAGRVGCRTTFGSYLSAECTSACDPGVLCAFRTDKVPRGETSKHGNRVAAEAVQSPSKFEVLFCIGCSRCSILNRSGNSLWKHPCFRAIAGGDRPRRSP